MLHAHVFKLINKTLGPLEIYLFASRLNHQLPRFFSQLKKLYWFPVFYAQYLPSMLPMGMAVVKKLIIKYCLSRLRSDCIRH